jgi:hypothetical protein
MLLKLLIRTQSMRQLIVASLGAFFGFFILLATVQLYIDLNQTSEDAGLFDAKILVIQKELGAVSFASDPEFSDEEIADLKKQDFIEKVGTFQNSEFKFYAKVDIKMGPNDVYMDMYFQAIEDEFLDVKDDEWGWQPGDTTIPIILPYDYLDFYNHGFAASKMLPKLSEKTFEMVQFNLVIDGADKDKERYYGKVVGFSEKIQSVLAPLTFVEYANERFSSNKVKHENNPSRLLLKTVSTHDPKLFNYLKKNGFKVKTSDEESGKDAALVYVLFTLFIFMGAVITVLSILSFIQYAQLLISKANYEIKVLIAIGYDHIKLTRLYTQFFAVIFSVITLFAIGAILIGKPIFNAFISSKGYPLEQGVAGSTWLFCLLFLCAYVLICWQAIYYNIKQLAQSLQ